MKNNYNSHSIDTDEVSYFMDRKHIPQSKGITQILGEIKQGKIKPDIEEIRKKRSTNVIAYEVLKSKLPVFTPSGLFKRSIRIKSLDKYNPLIMLDFDNIGADEAARLKEKAAKVGYTLGAFIRFNGDGLIILVKANSTKESHTKAFQQIAEYYNKELNAVSNLSGTNINNLCLLSYDPELYFNENAWVFELKELTDERLFADLINEQLGDQREQEIEATEDNSVLATQEYAEFEEVTNKSKTEDHKTTSLLSVNLMDSIAYYDKQPEPKYLWNGIIEGSFGYIFGPAGSGKTTFCENLGLSLAVGKDTLLGFRIDGSTRKKVLFIPLEEHGRLSSRRNKKQLRQLTESELINFNYRVPKEGFPDQLYSEKDWKTLLKLLDEFKPDIVFIDSMTRTVKGKIEDSDFSSEISLKLRNLVKSYGITLIVVHHSTKLNGNPITMDNLAGSRVIAQEADFIYGFNLLPDGTRYLKELKCRYKAISETITIFKFNENAWLEKVKDSFEDQVVTRPDLRENPATELLIYDTVMSMTSDEYPDIETKKLLEALLSQVTRSEIYRFLRKLDAKGRIKLKRMFISRV